MTPFRRLLGLLRRLLGRGAVAPVAPAVEAQGRRRSRGRARPAPITDADIAAALKAARSGRRGRRLVHPDIFGLREE